MTKEEMEQVRNSLALMKRLEAMMLSYRLVFEFVSDSGRFDARELYGKLKEAETAAQAQVDEKYDEALRTLAGTTDQAAALKALKFLAEWTPKSKPS